MTLDAMTAQIVMRARQIERVVHDRGPWSITVGANPDQWKIPARRVVGDDHVTFYALVPMGDEEELNGASIIVAELICDDDVVAVKFLEPVSGLSQLSWEFLVMHPEQVAV